MDITVVKNKNHSFNEYYDTIYIDGKEIKIGDMLEYLAKNQWARKSKIKKIIGDTCITENGDTVTFCNVGGKWKCCSIKECDSCPFTKLETLKKIHIGSPVIYDIVDGWEKSAVIKEINGDIATLYNGIQVSIDDIKLKSNFCNGSTWILKTLNQ